MYLFAFDDHILDGHSCQMCYSLEIKLLLLLLLMTLTLCSHKLSCTHLFDYMYRLSPHRIRKFFGSLHFMRFPIHKQNMILPLYISMVLSCCDSFSLATGQLPSR